MTDIHDPSLFVALHNAARELVHHDIRDMDLVLTRVVAAAAETVPGADGGGICRTAHGAVHAVHATCPAIRDLDQLQVDMQQGPCSTAADDPPALGVVIAHDLAGHADTARWPSFAPAAARAGYRSIMSAPLTSARGQATNAALNFYARQPEIFTDQAQVAAGMFAAQASLLLYGADQVAHLQRALVSRDLTGQAKGVLMERFSVDADQAFAMLVSASQETNMKLVDVARWLTQTGSETETQVAPLPTLRIV